MSSEWRSYKLADLATFKYGKFLAKSTLDEVGYPVFSGYSVVGFLPNYQFTEPQLVIVCRGEGGTGDVKLSPPRCSITNLSIVIAPNEQVVSRQYLYWALKASDTYKLRTGSAQAQIVIGSLEHFPVSIPNSRSTQNEISEFLDSLDDRITLLRETNATLEAIAQALFKSWFVDFDPVRAKIEGRVPEGMDEASAALFPDSFEETELGLVPRGWRVNTLGEMCAVTIGGLWGNDERDDTELTPAISLRGIDLEHLRIEGFAKNAPIRWVKPSAMEKRRLSENEVLIASSGAGPCGRPLWAGVDFEALYGMPVIFSNFVKRLDCGSPARAIYIDRLLAEMRKTREIWNYINGTSIPNLDDKLLLATKKVVVPDNAVLSAFESVARTIYERLYSQQAQTLATVRDTLLPRLISGQHLLLDVQSLMQGTKG